MMGPYNFETNIFFWDVTSELFSEGQIKLQHIFLLNLNHDKKRFFMILASSLNYRIKYLRFHVFSQLFLPHLLYSLIKRAQILF